MATKDISDLQVLRAYELRAAMRKAGEQVGDVDVVLAQMTGQPEKVCFRAMERAERRGLLEYGTCLAWAWITPSGAALLGEA
jgi:hypothetical protein